jgi:hypothetical protein
MFRFNFKTTTCNGSTIASYVSYNHAYFRAAYKNSDFALMELQNQISHYATFLGWDRSSTPASSATNIHHPKGDLMKISFSSSSVSSYSGSLVWDGNNALATPPNSHWKATLSNGATEKGSSGSPLFNQNHLVIGQLHGGGNGCAPVEKYYGRFDISWTGGGTNDTRLSNWLGTSNPGTTSIPTIYKITGPGVVPCTGTVTYTAPVNSSWTVSSNLQIVSGQGTSALTVKADTYNAQSQSASVSIGGVTKNVTIGPLPITYIDAPSPAQLGTVIIRAYPDFTSAYGSYEWTVSPMAGVTLNQALNILAATFTQPGRYTVTCRAVSPCTNQQMQSVRTKIIDVTVSGTAYSISNDDGNRIVTVSLANQDQRSLAKNTINYTLTAIETGVVLASGSLPSTGGTIDFSSVPAGIYILRLDTGTDKPETFKIMLK